MKINVQYNKNIAEITYIYDGKVNKEEINIIHFELINNHFKETTVVFRKDGKAIENEYGGTYFKFNNSTFDVKNIYNLKNLTDEIINTRYYNFMNSEKNRILEVKYYETKTFTLL